MTLNETLSLVDIDTKWPELRGGIHSPRVELLLPQKVFRFSGQSVPLARRLDSPWWFAERDFRRLEPILDRDSTNPGFLARMQGAVCYEWSDMDVLVVARILHPIKVFQGQGKYVVERTPQGGKIIYQPPQDLFQTFIPGLRTTARQALIPDVKNNLILERQCILAPPDEIDIAMRNLPPGRVGIMRGNPQSH